MILSSSLFGQGIVVKQENFLVYEHENTDTVGESTPLQRFDILVKYLGMPDQPFILAHQTMVAPLDAGLKVYKIKIFNVFNEITERGEFELRITAFDVYGVSSALSDPLFVFYDPAAPSQPINLSIE
jgi:hypothetical protein